MSKIVCSLIWVIAMIVCARIGFWAVLLFCLVCGHLSLLELD